jgi:hypothetical protein
MPKRTNTFQRVVAILHQQLAEGATTEESAIMSDRVTGDKKEVDVVIRANVAGYRMVLSVEATMSKAARPWVEQMIEKHRNLDTNRLILVSERGASPAALRYAGSQGVALLVPEVLNGPDPAFKVVTRLQSLWPKGFSLTCERIWITVERADGRLVRLVEDAPDDLGIYDSAGHEICNPLHLFGAIFANNGPWVVEAIGLAEIDSDRDEYFLGGCRDPHTGRLKPDDPAPLPLCLMWTETHELHRITKIEFSGRAVVRVAEFRLTHWRLGETGVAYAEGRLGDDRALLVIGENEAGTKATLSLTPNRPARADGEAATGYSKETTEPEVD